MSTTSRREFMNIAGLGVLTSSVLTACATTPAHKKRTFNISLAGWSLHKMMNKAPDKVDMAEMPKISKNEFGIDIIELVNQQMRGDDKPYIDKIIANAANEKVKIGLIMIDGQGNIASEEKEQRAEAVTKHSHWIDIAADMGCQSIRMNWAGVPRDFMKTATPDQVKALIDRSVPHFQELSAYGDKKSINVIIENHGGPSSHPTALIPLMKAVNHPRFGTLPDFGNFYDGVDAYDATDQMMPYAKAVSAKCYDFDDKTGDETKIDFEKMLAIVCDKHGYTGNIGIEYEGDRMSEFDGIKACKKLLEKLRG
jgi:L-ribulose-5-phosphate 3-epimerase